MFATAQWTQYTKREREDVSGVGCLESQLITAPVAHGSRLGDAADTVCVCVRACVRACVCLVLFA